MPDAMPLCPNCSSDLAYEMGALLACPMCAHEWSPSEAEAEADAEADAGVVKDAFGTPLADGDTVSIVKDLKVKGFPQSIKVGMKVRGIRLVDGFDGHNIDCKVDGFGQMQLKSSVVKKV
ncbi:zinc ribbon domain-containing protein YjdM [Demequina lutea]|uniref:Protein PhnA n=1 Tax=Demequina lutea TaxID=431489 RepID=A0A7Y9ZDJ6_9MICO|nr:zinc ribbon domain-containing protein YjdM [Demequina lutea]NYI42278.1 protein PhnA [Demequina lutea]